MFWAGVSYGLVIISYNPTFVFLVVPLAVYYLLLNLKRLKALFVDSFMFALGAGPFALIYMIFNQVRFGNAVTAGYSAGSGLPIPKVPPNYIIFEGIWSVLFSPGKSIFVYTPLLLLPVLFWFKLKKKLLPEIISCGVLFIIYTYFIGTFMGGYDYPVWHGEASWGPRYMLPILPLAIILTANVFTQLTNSQKLLVFTPLMLLGLYIQVLGVALPYQIRFAGLALKADINGRKTDLNEYGNLIPRHAPVYTMTKTLGKRIKQFPSLYDHGKYNLKLTEGFSGIFDNGGVVMREILPESTISFTQNSSLPINSLALQLINYQIDPASSISAKIMTTLNGGSEVATILSAGQDTSFSIPVDQNFLGNQNLIRISTNLDNTQVTSIANKQVIFLRNVIINGKSQPLKTLDYPFVSPFSKKMMGSEYHTLNSQDKWKVWHTRSAMYENTFDLWWIKPFHYWDLPKPFFTILLTINVLGIGYFGFMTFGYRPKAKNLQ